jgi:hypothetical protein
VPCFFSRSRSMGIVPARVSRSELHETSSFVYGIFPTEAEAADRCRILDELMLSYHA